MKAERMLKYFNTVKHLKPIQIKGQLERRLAWHKDCFLDYKPFYGVIRQIHIAIPELDEDEGYLSRFDIDEIMSGSITLLNETHLLRTDWHEPDASHLWNYNLHYLEFLIPLAVKYRQTREEKYKEKWYEILNSWNDHIVHKGFETDAHESYTISLRIPNLLIAMEYLRADDRYVYDSIYQQYQYLQRHLETALLANHYFENIKTIVIASKVFGEEDVYRKHFSLLLREIEEQILPDGMHYERSPMYHKLILEDVLRVYTVLKSEGCDTDAAMLVSTIEKMSRALWIMEEGFPRTPLFNDAGDNVSKSMKSILSVCDKIVSNSIIDLEKSRLTDSGYYRLDNGRIAVLFDSGDIGPSYMGGHAHNDCLSFELAIDGKMLFVNSGTGQYQGGLRHFFGSTKAHNTLMIDDREQSELWGEHRVARRMGHLRGCADDDQVIGGFCSYSGDMFTRSMKWKEKTLCIQDKIVCKDGEKHISRLFFHIAPNYVFERDGNCIKVVENGKMIAEMLTNTDADYLVHKDGDITKYAPEFGRYETKQVLEIRTPFIKEVDINTEIKIW